eukprot:3376055-Pyramimonas_sp.AAC.1
MALRPLLDTKRKIPRLILPDDDDGCGEGSLLLPSDDDPDSPLVTTQTGMTEIELDLALQLPESRGCSFQCISKWGLQANQAVLDVQTQRGQQKQEFDKVLFNLIKDAG